MSAQTSGSEEYEVADAATGLDMILTDAALGPLRRMVPPLGTSWRFARGLAKRPGTVLRRGRDLTVELGRITVGRSEVAPGKKDRRYTEDAWAHNVVLKRLMQAHLAAADAAETLVADADLDWQDNERVHFSVSNLADLVAPSNNPVLNPLTWKAAIDSGGRSPARGLRRMVRDLSSAPRVPSMVEPDAFKVGQDLAATPGSVVYSTPVFELIQYQPTTAKVREVPLLMVPPTINKYYIADLAPGRSIVEHVVASGQQVFMMSWRNPDARHAEWNLDTYAQAVLDAMAAVERITGVDRSALLAFCSGGMITSMVMAHLAAIGQQHRVSALGLAVTVLDQGRAGTTGALMDEENARAATKASQKKGYLDGATLAEVFAWLRPNDLIWNYWVNNYLQGKPPPAFDILYWNADTTRMTAGLHRDFIDVALTNALTEPGSLTVLGTPIDLSKVSVDSYVLAGIADHICPWQSCYRSTQLLGGNSRFVLSTNGHIASLVNPPGNPKATWRTATKTPADPDEWLDQAETKKGSWWPDYTKWLGKRSGSMVPAAEHLGGPVAAGAVTPTFPAAPGGYVYDK